MTSATERAASVMHARRDGGWRGMIRIQLSGNVGIEAGDPTRHHAEVAGRQARVVFAYLVLERHRAVPREELAEALWPDTVPQSWEAALRVVVSKVRSVFAAAGLASGGVLTNAFGCYQVHLPSEAIVDVEAAVASVSGAEAALVGGDLDKAISGALEARRIAARPFLPGESSTWAERTQSRLHGCLLRALEVLSHARGAQGDGVGALEAAEAAVELDPFRESAHRCVMAACAVSGNRAAALKAYERCRRLLASELGVGPSAETEAAYLMFLNAEDRKEVPEFAAYTVRENVAVPLPHVLRSSVTPKLVGREPELKRLREAWALVLEERRHVFLIAGEAGMGKTALSGHVASMLHEEGATVFYGRCDKDILVPYQPFVEAVDRYVRTCPADRLRVEVGPEGTDLARLVVDLPRWLPELSLPTPAEPETERHRLFGAVAAFLNGVARSAPVVLVLDDVQWIGSAALVLLKHVVRAVESSRVLVLGCYRDDELDPDGVLAAVLTDLGREPDVCTMRLPGLDEKAVAELMASIPGLDAAEPGHGSTIQEQTQGNPLFVTELLRHLLDSTWSSTGEHEALEIATSRATIPRTISEVIRQRCARLKTTTRQIMEIAAVTGECFGVDLLLEVSQLPEEQVIDALEESFRTRLVQEMPGIVGAYSFTNPFSREVVYSTLSGARRAYLHRRVGEALEHSQRSRLPAASAELAHHFDAAGETQKAIRYSIVAGDHATQCLAYEGAAHHYERGLALARGDSDDQQWRSSVLMRLATAHRKSGNVAAARDAYLEATKLARRLGDPVSLAACALGIGGGGRGVSAWIADEVRISLLEEALVVLGDEDSDLRVRVLAELAKALYFSPEEQRRETLAQEAVQVARRLGQPTALAGALSATRVIRWGPANTELRLVYGDEVLALGEQSGDPELTVRARLARIADLIEIGDRDLADSELDASSVLAADLRQPYYLWRTVSWDALRAIIDGRWHHAEQRAADALDLWHGRVHPDAVYSSRILCATIAGGEGRLDDAVDLTRTVADAHPMVPTFRCLLANFLVQSGRRTEGRTEFERFAIDGFLSPPVDGNWLTGAVALAEACALLNDRTRAGVLYELLLPFADRMVVLEAFGGGGGFLGPVSYYLGLLARETGEPATASLHFDAAHEASVRLRAGHYIEMIRVEQADMHMVHS
jgi:DNA-binding SARP family transcriptional activator/tetratricopeptide (TPR) repeat protein